MTPEEGIPERNTSSYPAALCRWIIRSTLRRTGIWIFVLDGFGQKDIQIEVRQLIQNLANQILVPEIARRIRLVLIDYAEDEVTRNACAKMHNEVLPSPTTLTDADVIACLLAHNVRMQSRGKPWGAVSPDEVPELAKTLLARASPNSSKRLNGIYTELLKIAQFGEN
jgi:hypothetical protein